MVVAILSGVIFAADVDDGVTSRKKSGVTGSNEGGWIIGGEHAEKVNGKGLVGVEVTTTNGL